MKHEVSFVISVIFDIITVIEQARNQEFFRAGEVSWNKSFDKHSIYNTQKKSRTGNNFGLFSPRYC